MSGIQPGEAAPSKPGLVRERWALPLVCVVVAFAVFGPVPFLGREALSLTFQDDSFYYFQVARNVALGNGPTFDGIHLTNGFHPLWLVILSAIYFLVPGDVPPLRVIALTETVLLVAAATLIYRTLKPLLGLTPALVAAFLVVAQPGAPKGLRGGTESSLFLLLIVLIWRGWLALESTERPSRGQWLGLGGLCALAVMARLEGVMLVPALLLLGHRRFRADPGSGLLLAAPAVLWAVFYATLNRILFGAWVSVSGLIKTGWARRWDNEASALQRFLEVVDVPWAGEALVRRLFGVRSLYEGSHAPIAAYLVLLALVACAAIRYRTPLAAAVRGPSLAFPLVAGGLVLLLDKLSIVYLFAWHLVPVYLATAVVAAALVASHPRLAQVAFALALAIGLARGPLTIWHWRDPAVSESYFKIRAADWFRANVGEEERIGSWNSGMLGYYSHRHVVGLDGLVGDFDYYRVIQSRQLLPYLREQRVAWLADYACGGDLRPSRALGLNPGHIMFGQQELDGEYELAADLHNTRSADGCPGWAIWRARWREVDPPRRESAQGDVP